MGVAARGLSVYQIVLFGAQAADALLWGVIAGPLGLMVTFLLAAVVQPQKLVLAKAGLCTICPVAGVDSQSTTSLGAGASGGTCSVRKAQNGYPLPDPSCTPGARTVWHTHPNGQTIYVMEGIGRAQRRGGPVEVIRPGDRVFFEPGEDHWHGASPTRFMTHLAMLDVDEHGNAASWGEHVSDAEYAAAPAAEEGTHG